MQKRIIGALDRSSAPPSNPSGIELPNASGVSEENIAPDMPVINMTPNNGAGPSIGTPPFADGRDMRNQNGGGSNSDPTPAMPGA